jgi:hypothetical protein
VGAVSIFIVKEVDTVTVEWLTGKKNVCNLNRNGRSKFTLYFKILLQPNNIVTTLLLEPEGKKNTKVVENVKIECSDPIVVTLCRN